MVEFRPLPTVVVGSISSGGDYGVYYWWDPKRSKLLFSVPYVARRCLPDFLVMIILIYHSFLHLNKYNIISCPCGNVVKNHNSDLWKRSPGGGRVLCREYVPSRHIRSSGCALSLWLVNSASLMSDTSRCPSGRVSVRSPVVEITVCTADETQKGRNSCSVFRISQVSVGWIF